MTKVDVNGNTTSTKDCYCKNLVRRVGRTYTTDAHGRIMVDLPDGGYVVFFKHEETRFAKWCESNLTQREAGEENKPNQIQ